MSDCWRARGFCREWWTRSGSRLWWWSHNLVNILRTTDLWFIDLKGWVLWCVNSNKVIHFVVWILKKSWPVWLSWLSTICEMKGHRFHCWSGHVPGLWVQSPVAAHTRGNQWMFLSLSFFLPPFPSPKINKLVPLYQWVNDKISEWMLEEKQGIVIILKYLSNTLISYKGEVVTLLVEKPGRC